MTAFPLISKEAEAYMGETADQFLVFDLEDRFHASVCFGEDEAREIVSYSKHPASVRVHRITLDEPVRDVTADFITDEDEPDEYPEADLEASIADHRHQLRMEGEI